MSITLPYHDAVSFFTELGATLFHMWLYYANGEISIIYQETEYD